MVIIKNDEYAHSLKPEFIKKVVQLGFVRTRSGYEYERHEYGNTGNYFITRKDTLTDEVNIICHIEVLKMSEDEIKDLIQTELEESGYMYTLGMLKGMYKAGAFNAVEWCTLSMYLADLNMDRIG